MEQLDRSEILAIFFQFFTVRFFDQYARNMKHTKQQFTLMVSHRLQNLLEDIEAVLKISLPWQQISAFLQNDWRYLKLSSALVFLPPLWNDVISFFAPNRQGMEFKRSVEKISYYLEWPQNKSKLHYPQEVVRNVGVWPLELSFEKAWCVHWAFVWLCPGPA